MKSYVPKRSNWFSNGTLIMVRVLALLLGYLSAYLLIYEIVPKTTGFDTIIYNDCILSLISSHNPFFTKNYKNLVIIIYKVRVN